MRGQIAIEFMMMIAMVLLIFTLSFVIYSQNVSESRQIEKRLAATQLCIQVASTFSSFASLEGNSSYSFDLPEQLGYWNYTVWVVSDKRKVSVDYIAGATREPGAACSMQMAGITNSTGSSSFGLEKNAAIHINGGKVIVTP